MAKVIYISRGNIKTWNYSFTLLSFTLRSICISTAKGSWMCCKWKNFSLSPAPLLIYRNHLGKIPEAQRVVRSGPFPVRILGSPLQAAWIIIRSWENSLTLLCRPFHVFIIFYIVRSKFTILYSYEQIGIVWWLAPLSSSVKETKS